MKTLSRLLVVSEPGKDGVFDYLRDLVYFLWDRYPNISIDYAYSSRRGSEAQTKLVEQVQARGGEVVDLKINNAPQLGDFRAGYLLNSLVKRRKPDLIHAHSSKAGALVRLLKMSLFGWPPVVYTPNAYFGMSGDKSWKTSLFNSIESMIGGVGATCISSPDEYEFARDVLKIKPRNLVAIFNGIDTNRFRPPTPEEKKAAREEFGLPATGPILLTIGRDSYQKNFPPLYKALEPILSHPDCQGAFVHSGAGSEELVDKLLSPPARKRATAFSFVKPIERLIQACDAFILASRYEGLSLSLLAALSTGNRMFVTRVLGNRCLEVLSFQGIGWIEHTEDSDLLSQRLNTALSSWFNNPTSADPSQILQTRQTFNSQIQYQKVYRLYTHLLQ